MNREIKFRGRVLLSDEWVYGDLTQEVIGEEVNNYYINSVRCHPDTIGQYTGLKDENGNEIYEGDILRSDIYPFSCLEDGEKDNYYAVVQWCDEDACFAAFCEVSAHAKVRGISAGMNLMDFSDVCFMELVGNIHDNFDLLRDATEIKGENE